MHRDQAQNNIYEIKIGDEDKITTEDQHINTVVDKDVSTEKNELTESDGEKTIPTDQNYFDQLQRLRAEFANYKKRMENERMLLSDIIKSELIKGLLPVIDDFERMLQHVDDEKQEIVKGIRLIYQQLMETLKMQGLKPVKAVGEKFNPNFHEALLAEHHEDSDENIVMEEWRKGYFFKDSLLRPAQVKVNKT